jgi:2-polyprenyl-3-methyl-5-hydroxy-6-metoxy-1,4-benzoquinol methylase
MTIEEPRPTLLPPSPFIRRFANQLSGVAPLDVLDVGCCTGRNAIHFAELGHNVFALDDKVDDLTAAQEAARGSVLFVAGDARKLMFHKMFDVVIMNETLHQMPKPDARQVLKSLRSVTNPGGFHAVSDYVADSKPNALAPFELLDAYNTSGWRILEYHEDPVTTRNFGDYEVVDSLATIITMRE